MAAVDYFLNLDGIKGESSDKTNKEWIDVESWSWGATQMGSSSHGGGAGAGKVALQDFHFVMKVNKATPNLMLHCANGKHIKKAVLLCRKAGGKQEDFLKVTMSDCLVSSYQTGGSGHSDIRPTDQISLNFSKIEIEYREQKPDGSMGAWDKKGWDAKQNVPV